MVEDKVINIIENDEYFQKLIDVLAADKERPIIVIYQHNAQGDNTIHLPAPFVKWTLSPEVDPTMFGKGDQNVT